MKICSPDFAINYSVCIFRTLYGISNLAQLTISWCAVIMKAMVIH